MHGIVTFKDGRKKGTHICDMHETFANTTLGTFIRTDGIWRWLCDDGVTMRIASVREIEEELNAAETPS